MMKARCIRTDKKGKYDIGKHYAIRYEDGSVRVMDAAELKARMINKELAVINMALDMTGALLVGIEAQRYKEAIKGHDTFSHSPFIDRTADISFLGLQAGNNEYYAMHLNRKDVPERDTNDYLMEGNRGYNNYEMSEEDYSDMHLDPNRGYDQTKEEYDYGR